VPGILGIGRLMVVAELTVRVYFGPAVVLPGGARRNAA
jgi:hypothetical protein